MIESEPQNYEKMLKRNYCDKWIQAMKEEMNCMYKNGVWELAPKKSDMRIVSNRRINRSEHVVRSYIKLGKDYGKHTEKRQ